jgi:two-component system NtrC family sensor kinase
MFACESPDQLTGGNLLDSVIPGEREWAVRSIREVLAHGSVRDIQHTMLRKDGSRFPAEISAGLISRRPPATIVVTIKDITEHRLAEEKLKRERDLICRIAETSPAGIVMADRRGKIVFANDQAEKVLGLSRREIARRSYNDPVWRITDYRGNPFSQDALPFTRVARERRAVYDVRHAIQWPDGRRTLLSVNAAPLFDERGGFDGMVATVEDVTERVLAEQTLRRLSAAIEQVEETIIITDLEGCIRYVNTAGVRSSGYTREELIGSHAEILGSDDTDPDVLDSLWSTIRSGRTWTGEWINRHKDGGTYREQVTVSPVRDESGCMVGFVSAQRDITHVQELERQLLHAQKMESVGRLAGGIAHDFNNLLTVISGNAELLHMALPDSSDLAPGVEEIISTTRRAAALTRQLLVFSRKQVMQPRVLDINKLLRDMGTLLRRLIGEDIELSILLSQPLPSVKIDPGQLEQVMTNLAVNAHDAMNGGGTLTVETRAVAVPDEEPCSPASGGCVPPGGYVLVTVSDTGTGMDPDTASRVFEPFFTTKERDKGTGLGLSTCYGIVKQHGGHIHIRSARGEGTTVYLYLPAVEAPAEGIPEQESGDGPAGKGETVLLVEDDAGVRSMVGRCLTSRGYRVLEAAHGAEGLSLVAGREREVDLLITDLIMPQMGSRELKERLQRTHPGVKVLLMSGYVEPTAVDLESPDEGVRFLPKPFTPSMLYEKIREVLDG